MIKTANIDIEAFNKLEIVYKGSQDIFILLEL